MIGLLGATLLLARAAFALGPDRRSVRFAVLAACMSAVPVDGLVIAGYVRGVVGDLSITSLVLLLVGFVRPAADARGDRFAISALVIAGALFVYPMALGLTSFDPYRLGFAPRGLLTVLFVIAFAAWLARRFVLLAILVAAVTSHAFGLFDSQNLWDYLIDPWVLLASIYDLWSHRRNS
jgi:hypothetical protein